MLTRGINQPTSWILKNIQSVPQICKVGQLILLVFPLYCAHRLDTERLIEIDIFGRSERLVWPTNLASNRPTNLF